jgi:hypothetical protein
MKQILIATTVAAVMAAPAAMGGITIGGQLQAEIVSASGNGVQGNVGKDDAGNKTLSGEGLYLSDGWQGGTANKGSASSFWLKGIHDIGNGLAGLYKLNFNPEFVGGVDSFSGRDAFIGLKGGFGAVLLGKMNTPYKSSTVKWDPFLATFLQARGNGGMSRDGHNDYAGNVIAYANELGHATVIIAAALDESKDDPANHSASTNGDHALTASINVPVGSVELALAYIDTAGYGAFFDPNEDGVKDGGVDGTDNIEAFKLGVKYGGGDISPLTLAAQYETIDIGGYAAFEQFFATAGYQFGANTVSLNVGITQQETADDGEYFALGLNHAFNKKVSTLFGISKSDDQDANSGNDDGATLAGVSMRFKF